LETSGRLSGTVIQALRHVGKDHITPESMTTLRTVLTDADRKSLLNDSQFAPAWMRPQLRAIAESPPHA
jgi:SOS response regulatory protein OraA/RecX